MATNFLRTRALDFQVGVDLGSRDALFQTIALFAKVDVTLDDNRASVGGKAAGALVGLRRRQGPAVSD